MESGVLPDWEMILYWFLSFTSHFYSFYQLHLFSKEHEESLDREVQLEKSFLIRDRKKDAADFEWSFWNEWAWRSLLWSLIGHAMVSKLSSVCMPQLRKAVLTVYGVLCAWWLLGSRGVAVLMLHLTVSLAVAQLRNPALSWGCTLLLLSTLHISSVQDLQRGWYDSDECYYLLTFSIAMCVLRCVSFSLELCWSPLQGRGTNQRFSVLNFTTFLTQFYDLVSYCFYHPLFYNGPVINYNHFSQQMDSAVCKASPTLLLSQTLRVCVWWCLAELMIHFMYMHTIQNNETYLTMLPPWALGGLALALVQFFYVKYLVLFGVASLLMKLDGIEPPPLPRCVSTMYSFRGMWRYFDVGLYRWLIRYVYVPLGGSQHGLFQKLISMAMTFSFVCLWHGCHDYLQCWALLNWVCVLIENSITLFLCWPPLHHATVCYLSPPMRRRGLALISAFSTAMLILSNLVFLGGIHVGCVYWERVFMQETAVCENPRRSAASEILKPKILIWLKPAPIPQ
ncbi:protein-cysteine N-palmitoyltransferase HHAT isoform X1 [Neoarius graeffei]|uniref:protein-cysteine N-palmitoyltransferase HHAT isoform X1 n=1 Tax=Neoarius graeffei TaxID=443677 RepID=UPI00298C43C3|nr:protein-cysteine N-palmitoyltransferase HHAT isoform X1 [Neoarius graeffei]XP_060789247.1 protein-cysteine N-palmitoyltransferase HHAT isoform X1 [Neoarius graeffei]XP_060789248.1 protein-cysteine N-palmitoyltransferase HHAT isoform X1 [Neoarius graeffei]